MKTSHILALTLPFLASAAPTPSPLTRRTDLTSQQIETISPNSASCDNAPIADECADSATAAKNIAASFDTYKVTNAAEQAAVIAIMAFESEDFKYNHNQNPGVAGQGTRNMQSPTYNSKYAASIPALSDQYNSVSSDPSKVLDLLTSDETYDFGSGAWFLTSQCSQDVRSALQSGSESGWEQYITDCVGTSANEERKAYWTRAIQALGVQSS